MKLLKNILFIFVLSLSFQNNLFSDIPYFVDFKYILNESSAGKKAQTFLKKKIKWWYRTNSKKRKKHTRRRKKNYSTKKSNFSRGI